MSPPPTLPPPLASPSESRARAAWRLAAWLLLLAAPAPAADADLSYRSEIRGVEDAQLSKLLEESSQLLALRKQPPPTRVALERRVRSDLDQLQRVLRSEGYYGAKIDYRLTGEQPVQVTLEIELGDRYRLLEYAIHYAGDGADDPALPRQPDDVGVRLGDPARAELVVSARRRLLALLAERSHPLAEVSEQRVIVDHDEHGMRVTLELAPGPKARFGPVAEVSGATDVEPDYIESFAHWQAGEPFDRRKLDRTREQLLETGLFAGVALERPNELDERGELPITLRVEERKHRSIGLGGRWSTDEGFAVEALWEHRNLFGRGERLSVDGDVGQIKQEASATFRKPRFLRPDQDLLLDGALALEDTDAYQGPLTRTFAGLERGIGAHWRIVSGVPFELSELEDLAGRRQFALVGLEARAERDSSDDRLNPSSGTRFALALRPYHGVGDQQVAFLTSVLRLAGYRSLDEGARFVLAGRARLGSTLGEGTRALPANHRFYAGGGASVRGYRFQSVGPLGPGETPLGGRSLFELSLELRTAITESIGLVTFVDGGNVYDDVLPDFATNPRYAAGVGARYFTTFGPIRLDFAFPLNRRDGIDDFMQFYVSIGQAF